MNPQHQPLVNIKCHTIPSNCVVQLPEVLLCIPDIPISNLDPLQKLKNAMKILNSKKHKRN
jgi:hypothetical protein